MFQIICQNSHLTLISWFYKILWSHTLLFLNDRWLIPAAPHARAPRNVSQPQVSQPDVPQEASPEEKPFEIELVVPESPTAQDSSAEEQQQPGDQDTEDKTNGEHPPPSDTEAEKMY
jgi:hypothetical protein